MQIQIRVIAAFALIVACMATPLFAAQFDESQQLGGQRQGVYPAPMTRDEALINKLEESAQQPRMEEEVLQPELQKKGAATAIGAATPAIGEADRDALFLESAVPVIYFIAFLGQIRHRVGEIHQNRGRRQRKRVFFA